MIRRPITLAAVLLLTSLMGCQPTRARTEAPATETPTPPAAEATKTTLEVDLPTAAECASLFVDTPNIEVSSAYALGDLAVCTGVVEDDPDEGTFASVALTRRAGEGWELLDGYDIIAETEETPCQGELPVGESERVTIVSAQVMAIAPDKYAIMVTASHDIQTDDVEQGTNQTEFLTVREGKLINLHTSDGWMSTGDKICEESVACRTNDTLIDGYYGLECMTIEREGSANQRLLDTHIETLSTWEMDADGTQYDYIEDTKVLDMNEVSSR